MPTLADSILSKDIHQVRQWLNYREVVNELDEYGFTPLIESTIVNDLEICSLLLEAGANPNIADVTGGTALHWAVENSNLEMIKRLLKAHANPNVYNLAGMPPLVMAILRRKTAIRQCLVANGADPVFAQDFINAKMLGHIFELMGTANIISPNNDYVEVDFEGFFLEVTLGLIAESLAQFRNHFAARELRKYLGLAQFIVTVMQRAAELIHYQQYQVNRSQHETRINQLISQDPLIIPIGYEGHAITFVRLNDLWAKCDRREDERHYDHITIYKIQHTERCTTQFIKQLIYQKQSDQFINEELESFLGLTPITDLKIETQISGNCSWANVEAAIPTLFFIILMQFNHDTDAIPQSKAQALHFFHRWREWNKDRSLQYLLQSFKESDSIRKATKAEILAAILFQRSASTQANDRRRCEQILEALLNSPYEYILKNYLRIFYYESNTEEGKRFAALLKEYDFPK